MVKYGRGGRKPLSGTKGEEIPEENAIRTEPERHIMNLEGGGEALGLLPVTDKGKWRAFSLCGQTCVLIACFSDFRSQEMVVRRGGGAGGSKTWRIFERSVTCKKVHPIAEKKTRTQTASLFELRLKLIAFVPRRKTVYIDKLDNSKSEIIHFEYIDVSSR